MTAFFEFLSSNELTIVICLMVVIFLLIMTVIMIDIVSKRKNNDLIDNDQYDVNKELEDTNIKFDKDGLGMIANSEAIKDLDMDAITKNLEKTKEIEEIKYVEEDAELEKTKALLELETIKKELAKLEAEKEMQIKPREEKKEEVKIEEPQIIKEEVPVINEVPVEKLEDSVENNIENESTTQENDSLVELQTKINTYEDEVNNFESMQEENAIISVEELTKASQNITDEEIEQYEDDGNEPISLKELEALYKSVEQEEVPQLVKKEEEPIPAEDIVKPASEVYDDKEFKNTPVISPVYGLKKTEASIALEQTANLDKLNEEIRKTNEFLLALKELRKNLD